MSEDTKSRQEQNEKYIKIILQPHKYASLVKGYLKVDRNQDYLKYAASTWRDDLRIKKQGLLNRYRKKLEKRKDKNWKCCENME